MVDRLSSSSWSCVGINQATHRHTNPLTLTVMTMRSAAAPIPILLNALIISLLAVASSSFSFQSTRQHRSRNHLAVIMSATEQNENDQQQQLPRHPHCDLPGDPSLFLTTNVNLGDNKGAILKELSSLVATVTKKPESYVGE